MKALEHSIPARYFAQLLDHLESQGTPCRDALSVAQVRTLNDTNARLTLGQVDALLGEAVRLTGRTDLGFQLGSIVHLNSHDVLGYAFLSAATVDQVLRLAERYFQLLAPMFTLRFTRHASHAELLYTPTMAMSDRVRHFYLECMSTALYRHLQTLTGADLNRFDAFLPSPMPRHTARFRELGAARYHFGQDQYAGMLVLIDSAILDTPLPLADPRALREAETRCKQLLEDGRLSGRCGEWITMMLRQAEDRQPTLTELAGVLHVSERTLERYLENENLGFRDLAVKVRNERACALLGSGRYAVSQVAYRLGYSDLANFSRSFKRLNGLSPSEFARQHA